MDKENTLSTKVQLHEEWPPISRRVELTPREVGDKEKSLRQLVTLSSVGKVIHRLQWYIGKSKKKNT